MCQKSRRFNYTGLSRRPCHPAPTQEVKVNVENILSGIPACIQDDPKSAFQDAFLLSDLAGL